MTVRHAPRAAGQDGRGALLAVTAGLALGIAIARAALAWRGRCVVAAAERLTRAAAPAD
jgi:hypothetical protein